jgi:PPOX class probable F420-dependent enzyme
MFDDGTELGARAVRRLREEIVVWMTTVSRGGVPLPMPVWFLWDGEDHVLMYSRESPRVRNLEANPNVTLNFDGDGDGGDIVVLSGRAAIDRGAPAAHEVPDYLAKYDRHIERLGMTPETFAERYQVPVRIELTQLRGH